MSVLRDYFNSAIKHAAVFGGGGLAFGQANDQVFLPTAHSAESAGVAAGMAVMAFALGVVAKSNLLFDKKGDLKKTAINLAAAAAAVYGAYLASPEITKATRGEAFQHWTQQEMTIQAPRP